MGRDMTAEPVSPDLSAVIRRLALVAAIFLGFLTRAATFQSPLFDFHSWRQADTATIARNFVTEGFTPLEPKIDARGAQADGAVESGLELMALLAAAVAHVVGFSPVLGRLISALSFPLAGLLLYRFIRDRHGEGAALAGVWIYALGLPLTLYVDRAFLNESLLALLTIVCLRATQQYLAGRQSGLLILCVASTLLGLVKPPYLVVWTMLAGLFVERHGWRGLLRWEIGAGIAVNGLAVWLWFSHAHEVFSRTGLSFGTVDKLFDASLLTWHYAWLISSRLTRDVLGPIGVIAALVGLTRSVTTGYRAEIFGVLGFLFYVVVVTGGNLNHNYYQLQIVPVGTVLAGLGVVAWVQRTGDAKRWLAAQRLRASAFVIGLAVLAAFVRNAGFHSWYEVDQTRAEVCRNLSPRLATGELVAFVGYKSPDILFCLDRRGWLLDEDTPHDQLRRVIPDGAGVIVIPTRYEDRIAAFDPTTIEPLWSSPSFVAVRVRR